MTGKIFASHSSRCNMEIFRLLLNQASRSSRLLSLNSLRIVSACYFKQATPVSLSSLSSQFLVILPDDHPVHLADIALNQTG